MKILESHRGNELLCFVVGGVLVKCLWLGQRHWILQVELMSSRACFLETHCTSEEITHAQGRQNNQAFIEPTRLSFEGLFSPLSSSAFHHPVPLIKYVSILQKNKQWQRAPYFHTVSNPLLQSQQHLPFYLAELALRMGAGGTWLKKGCVCENFSSKEGKGMGDKRVSNVHLKRKENLIKMCWLTQNTWAWTSKGS